MKEDIDRLMQEASLDALRITGSNTNNPPLKYFTGRSHLTQATLLKKVGQPPTLFHQSMERDEARRTGLPTKNLDDYDWFQLLQESDGDALEASAQLHKRLLEDFDVSGRVAVYGQVELGPSYAILKRLEELMPDVEWVGEHPRNSVITKARATKDPQEVENIRQVGEASIEVVRLLADYLTSRSVKNGSITDSEGRPITVGLVKRRINLWLAERGIDNPEGTIFAQGRDAGVPHSVGEDEDEIRLGVPIVFDLFPAQAGGGYYHDFTRTWCLGHAPDEVLEVYEDVREVYEQVNAALEVDMPCRELQLTTCEAFESRGHPTVKSHPKTQEGYVHSLGHGIGLAVHEGPSFSHVKGNTDRLLPGSVITIEPGLYYPDRDLGVRLEDTVWIRPDGGVERLVEYPLDLVLEMQR